MPAAAFNREERMKDEMDLEIRLADLVDESVVDGTGIRMTLFTQGCPHRCPGCHNPTTHAFEGGHPFTVRQIAERIARDPLLDGVTLSGGEPFVWAEPLAVLCRWVHAHNMNVWCYTGYTYEQLLEKAASDGAVKALLDETDVLVDGPFILEEKDLLLKFRGSRNQRVIDMKATRAAGRPVLKPD